jgi:peptidoglycan/LPS O-acetylase OafA/YrhL
LTSESIAALPVQTFDTLDHRLNGSAQHANAFNAIRLVAATSVIFSHAFVLTSGKTESEPISRLTHGQSSIGHAAVGIFFIVSGLLISVSFDRSRSWLSFARNRALRIMPALWVCTLLSAFVLGPIVSRLQLASYLAEPELRSFLKALFFLPDEYRLPGVFKTLPLQGAVNGSLWTLKYEVACYILGAVLLSLPRFRTNAVCAIWILCMVAARGLPDPHSLGGLQYHLVQMIALFRFYGAGMLFYLWRRHVRLSGWAAAGCVGATILALLGPAFNEVLVVAGGYALVVLAYRAPDWFRRLSGSSDVSYGVYIYAFPIQQLLVPVSLAFSVSWVANIILALPLTFAAAALSWTFVENPCLSLKRRKS